MRRHPVCMSFAFCAQLTLYKLMIIDYLGNISDTSRLPPQDERPLNKWINKGKGMYTEPDAIPHRVRWTSASIDIHGGARRKNNIPGTDDGGDRGGSRARIHGGGSGEAGRRSGYWKANIPLCADVVKRPRGGRGTRRVRPEFERVDGTGGLGECCGNTSVRVLRLGQIHRQEEDTEHGPAAE